MKILVCNKKYEQAEDMLESQIPGSKVVACELTKVIESLDGVDVLVPSVAPITAEIIEKGKFGLIQQLGVGLDNVDIEAATRYGVWVANVPGAGSGNTESVAELAIAMMMTLGRRLDVARKNLADGIFFLPTGMALLNKTVCIVGLGDIGKGLAERLRPFGMRMLAVREHPEHGAPPGLGIEKVFGTAQIREAVANADFVVLAVPETKSTRNLFNAETLASMKKGSFLINVGRGGVLDTDALLNVLQSGHLAGAGLDVYTVEPFDPSHPIFKQNVVATPHVGGNTDESWRGVTRGIIENIKLYASGQKPKHVVNEPATLRKN
jgi:phosphoglycerate dehydrogenase-like enzyme